MITVTVTAEDEDGDATKTYTVMVTRAAADASDATLSALSLSGVTLDPAFAPATRSYTATVLDCGR